MDTNCIIDANIVDSTQLLYNYDKEMSNMSYVIMMKCSDGIVCGADSRSTLILGNAYKNVGDVKKVFSNNNLIIGTFNTNQVFFQTSPGKIKLVNLDTILPAIIQNSNTVDSFINEFIKATCQAPISYNFYVGWKENGDYRIAELIINKNDNSFKLVEDNSNILAISTLYTFSSPTISVDITCEKAKKIIHKMIETTEYLQSELLEYQNVAGDIVIETLK